MYERMNEIEIHYQFMLITVYTPYYELKIALRYCGSIDLMHYIASTAVR